MYIWSLMNFFFGYLRIEIEGYYIEKFINLCIKNKINIWNLKRDKGTKLFLNIGINDFKKLSPICRKTKCRVKIQKKKGIPFILNRYRKRKVFVIFLLFVSFFIYFSSCYIWNIEIHVEDNYEIDGIEKDLKDFGIKKGTNKKDVEPDNVANEIRLKRDDISWIGINIKGTNLIVNIVKADDKPEIIDNNDFCNIVSAKNGVVEKVIAQNGTPLVKKGDNIQKGDILIAGYMEGKYTERRLVHSQGEVQARIFYTKTQKIPLYPKIFEPTGQNEKKFQIKFNNFQINLFKTLSKFKIYDTIYTEQNLKIFSNFYLPISVVKITNNEMVKTQKSYSVEEAKNLGIEELAEKIEKQIEHKENIIKTDVDVKEFEKYIELSLTYEVLENIGTYEKIEY